MRLLSLPIRLTLRLLRASLHAAVVLTASLALLLLFLLWSVLQLFPTRRENLLTGAGEARPGELRRQGVDEDSRARRHQLAPREHRP